MKFESELAEQVFTSKYLLEGETTADEAVNRVVKTVSKIYPEIESEALEYINKQWFLPAGGVWRASGNPNKNVSFINCTNLGHIEDNLEGIFTNAYKWAKYAAYGQGEGQDLSLLRPKGAKVHNSSHTSSGAVSFAYIYDMVLKVITQNGRRGASLFSMIDHHPDIFDFIFMKDKPESDKSRIDTANTSVKATDEFMKAVINDDDWLLWFENKYERIEKKVKAREVFDAICLMAWKLGDPGLQFIDTWKKYSNSDPLGYPLEASNACQPGWAKLLTPNGLHKLEEINIGDKIWSKEGWTVVVNKWSTGKKAVHKFQTTAGVFYGTTDHKIVSEGNKLEVNDAESIDQLIGSIEYFESISTLNIQDIMDGLVLGDGSVHKASNNLVHLYIGKKDQSYLTSEIAPLIIKHRPGLKDTAYEITTTIKAEELGKTYTRKIPGRFMREYKTMAGFLRGLFSANGSIAGNRVTLKASSKQVIEDAQTMLSALGIRSYYTTNKSRKNNFSNGIYTMKESYDLNITRDRKRFSEIIGFIQPYKNESLKITPDSDKPIKQSYDIVGKEYIGDFEVFDITVDNISHTYWTQGCNVSNCGEIPADKDNVCMLGHINLAKYHEYGHEGFIKLIKFQVKFLNACRLTEYNEERSPVPEQRKKLIDIPRIGGGDTGFADYLLDKKIAYGSEESIKEREYIGKTMAKYAYKTGYELAKKYGSFPAYNKEKMKESAYIQRLLSEGVIEDSDLDYQFNVQYLTIAPVGSQSLVANVGGSGIEPIFSKYYVRRERSTTSDWKEWFSFNAYVERYLKEHNMEVTKENADTLIDDYWVMSYDVDNYQKIKLVAEAQKWIDSSISVTFNLDEDATVEDVKKIYIEAWKHGLKGITVYREGSLAGVMITEKNYNKIKKEEVKEKYKGDNYVKRPDELPCDIYEVKYKDNKFIVLIGLKDDEPYEVFVSPNDDGELDVEKYKKGTIKKIKSNHYDLIVQNGITKTMINNIGKSFDSLYGTVSRMVSMSLRHGVSLHFIVDQLNKDSGFVAFEKVLSRTLKKYIKDNTKTRKVCPECGETLIYQDGCISCSSCSWSKCD